MSREISAAILTRDFRSDPAIPELDRQRFQQKKNPPESFCSLVEIKKLNFLWLEGVPQCDLHLPRLALNGCEVCPVRWGRQVTPLGIASYTKARTAGINRAKRLIVRNVKHVPAELQLLLLAPGHVERFAEAHVAVHIPWFAEIIPRAG